MTDHMTAIERGHRALRESGYASGGAVHADEAEDKALIKSELSKARISTRNKGGKIKGAKPKETPGRRRRAAGGATESDDDLRTGGGDYSPMAKRTDDLRSGGSDYSPMVKRADPHSADTLSDDTPMKHRAAGGSITEEQHPPGDDEPSKFARGGRTHGKPGIGKVNIVIAHPGGGSPPAPGAGAMPPHPPMAPPPMAAPPPRPMMPPPGAMPPGPGGPPPGPPGGAPMPMVRPQGIRHGGHVRDVMGRFLGGGV